MSRDSRGNTRHVTSQALTAHSGELDMTVDLLIQVDKLVQLIESPVFTCACAPSSV